MKLDQVNKWLTLMANAGVLAGIIFLSLEINQSNRIAVQEAHSNLTSELGEVQNLILENQELARVMSKLATGGELSPEEQVQAVSFAWTFVNQAAALYLTYENGFISDAVMGRYLRAQSAQIDRFPGVAPYLSDVLDSVEMSRGVSPAFDKLIDTVDKQR